MPCVSPVSLPAVLAHPSVAPEARMPFWLCMAPWGTSFSEKIHRAWLPKALPSSLPFPAPFPCSVHPSQELLRKKHFWVSLSFPATAWACPGLSRLEGQGCLSLASLPHHRAAISFALLFGIVPYLNLTPAKSHFGWLYQIRDGQQPSVELSPVIHRQIPAPIHYTMLIYSLLKPKHFRAGKENLEVFT